MAACRSCLQHLAENRPPWPQRFATPVFKTRPVFWKGTCWQLPKKTLPYDHPAKVPQLGIYGISPEPKTKYPRAQLDNIQGQAAAYFF